MLSCVYQFVEAQSKIDSLEQVLKHSKGEDKVKILNLLSAEYLNKSKDKARQYAETAIKEAKKIGDKSLESVAVNNIGDIFYSNEDHENAIAKYLEALQLAQNVNNIEQVANYEYNIAFSYDKQGNHDEAIKFYKRSMEKFTQLNKKDYIASILNSIGIIHYDWGEREKALEYYKKALDISREIDDKSTISNTLNNIGIVYDEWGKKQEAMEFYEQSLQIDKQLNNDVGVCVTLHNIAGIHKDKGNYNKALNLYQQSLDIEEQLGNIEGIANTLTEIGNLYFSWGNYKKALEYFKKSFGYEKEIDNEVYIGEALTGIGKVHLKVENYEKALNYFNEAFIIHEQIGFKAGIAEVAIQIGEIYFIKNKSGKSLEFFDKALKINKELNYKSGIAKSLNCLGDVFFKQNDKKKTLEYYSKSLQIAKQANLSDIILNNYEDFSDVFSKMNNYKEAYKYHKLYSNLHDSIFNEKTHRQIIEVQTKYETEKKEREIKLLSQEKEIEKAVIKKQKIIRNSFIAGFAFTIVLVLLAFNQIRIKKKINKELIKEIEERKYTEKLLHESDERFQLALRGSNEGLWDWNLIDNTVYYSPRWISMLGFKEDEIGNTIYEWNSRVHPDDYDLSHKTIHEHIEGKTPYYEHIHRIRHKDGHYLWVHGKALVSRYENDKAYRIVGTMSDFSERKRIEKVLEEAKNKAEESDRLKSAFLANMSHEIRTPMNVIIGFTELLVSQDLTQEEKYEFSEHIMNNSKTLLHLIDDIIDISKIDAGELKIIKKNCLVNKMLSELFDTFSEIKRIQGKEKIKIYLKKEFENQRMPIITDTLRLNQILSNLLYNALKFTETGYIEFGYSLVEDKESMLRFYVKDTGFGIPKKMHELIFDRFRKVEDPVKLFRGTGLGLAISKRLTELLGGKIWVESELGKGSIFYFTIPFEKGEEKISMPATLYIPKVKYNWSGKTVLIVEDENTNYIFIEKALRNTNVKIFRAKNGKEAVKIFTERKNFDLILMDIKLPVMNGYEATKLIRKSLNPKKMIPIIAQTAFAMADEKERILNSGFDDYLSKPFSLKQLLEIIDKYFGSLS
jgi:PAS domain S-box-containing protein